MSLCINPQCRHPDNSDRQLFCQTCGSELLLGGHYRVSRLLSGKGGFGITYEALCQDRPVVLKVLFHNHPKAVDLFDQEAQLLQTLDHPGIPKGEAHFLYYPHDGGDPLHCLVMAKVEGMDLEDYQTQRQNQPIPAALALAWLRQVAEILHQVHRQGFFHRDIKPSNIILQADGQLALIDFGAARQMTATIMAGGLSTGIYTPGYAPPEQEQGHGVPQSDFFALGRTMVYLLTGKEPHHADLYDPVSHRMAWRSQAPAIAPALADLIDCLMAPAVKDRPADTQSFLQMLDRLEGNKTGAASPSPPARIAVSVAPPPPGKPWLRRRILGLTLGGVGTLGLVLWRKHPPTSPWLVASDGSGRYKTIQEALRLAPVGAVITIRPGQYQGPLLMRQDVTLIGLGDTPQAVAIHSDATTYCVQGLGGRVTLRSLALVGLATVAAQQFALEVSHGEMILENCDLSSTSLACVGAHGTHSRITLKNCTLHDGNETGVLIYQQAQAKITACQVYGHRLAGVEVREKSQLTLTRSTLRDNAQSGCYIHDGAIATLEDCTFTGNGSSGNGAAIAINTQGKPIIRRCTLAHGLTGGLFCYGGGGGEVEDCDIYDNGLAGIEIREGGDPVIRRCKIYQGKKQGFYAHHGGLGTLEACDVYDNTFAEVDIRTAANPQLLLCKIHHSPGTGVYVAEGGLGSLKNCDIYQNQTAGIHIAATGDPLVQDCTIRENQGFGLVVAARGKGRVVRSQFTNNHRGDTAIAPQSQTTFIP